MSSSDTISPSNQQTPANDEIDLRLVTGALVRHRLLISAVAGSCLLLSAIIAYTKKPVWEGQFQIVLEQSNAGSTSRLTELATSNPLLSNLTGLGGGSGSQLKTETKILKSPLVLKPTYDFVKANKARSGKNVDRWNFRKWRNGSLTIELEKGTSVLNISYRDTDADLIIPVLENISRDYQRYSGRDRSKSIRNGLSFIKEQVAKFRRQSASSSRELDAFSIRYGISSSGKSSVNSSSVASRILSSGSDSVIPLNPSISNKFATTKGDAFDQLASINQELIRLQQRFTSIDPTIRALIRERDALRHYIELTAGGSLTLPGQQPATKEEAQEIILKFQELNRAAKRDISTLSSLESSLLSLQLEKARQTDPWELISTPTLLDSPVAPRKSRLLALGLLTGLVAGSGVALLVDRKSGLVFSTDELKLLLPCPLCKHLPALNQASWHDAADLLANGPLATDGVSPIALVPIGDVPSDQLQGFASELRRALGGRELLVSDDLRQTNICATQLLLTAPGVATRTQLSQLNQKLALQGSPLAGWVLLDPQLKLS